MFLKRRSLFPVEDEHSMGTVKIVPRALDRPLGPFLHPQNMKHSEIEGRVQDHCPSVTEESIHLNPCNDCDQTPM